MTDNVFPPAKLSPGELAHLWRCSSHTIGNLIASGELRATKIGDLRRVDVRDARAFLEAHTTGKKYPRTDEPESPLLLVEDVAERLHVNVRTACNLLITGQLRGAKIGKLWRVRYDDLAAYLGSVATSAPPLLPASDPAAPIGVEDFPDDLLGVAEIALLVGMAESHVATLCHRGLIKCSRIGGGPYRARRSDVEAFIANPRKSGYEPRVHRRKVRAPVDSLDAVAALIEASSAVLTALGKEKPVDGDMRTTLRAAITRAKRERDLPAAPRATLLG